MILFVGVVIGLVLGLTGAGGSIFAVPLLVLLLDFPVQMAAGLSLSAVCISALVGVLFRLRSRQIEWLPALVFAVIGSAAVPFGGAISQHLNDLLLLCSFSVLVCIIAIRMWRQASLVPEATASVRAHAPKLAGLGGHAVCGSDALSLKNFRFACFLRVALAAGLTGILSGLYGVGGGFVIVPVLVSLLGMDIHKAVATSLLVIAVVSGVGFVSFATRTSLDPNLLGLLALGGVLGMMLGLLLSRAIAGPVLQKIFAVMMLLLTLVMLLSHFIIS